MTLRDLIKSTSYKGVFNSIYKKFYKSKPDEEVAKYALAYSDLYKKLENLNFSGDDSLKIYITEKEEIVLDDEEPSKFIDVCLLCTKSDELFSIDLIGWSKLIDLEVLDTLNLNKYDLLANILWEITFYGFTETEIKKQRKLLEDSINEKPHPISFDNFMKSISSLK